MNEQVLLKYVSFDMIEGEEAFISDDLCNIIFDCDEFLYVIPPKMTEPLIITSRMITYYKYNDVIVVYIAPYPEIRIPVKGYRMIGYKVRNILLTYHYNNDKIFTMERLCIMPDDFQKESLLP